MDPFDSLDPFDSPDKVDVVADRRGSPDLAVGASMSSEQLREQLEDYGFSSVEAEQVVHMMDPDGTGEIPLSRIASYMQQEEQSKDENSDDSATDAVKPKIKRLQTPSTGWFFSSDIDNPSAEVENHMILERKASDQRLKQAKLEIIKYQQKNSDSTSKYETELTKLRKESNQLKENLLSSKETNQSHVQWLQEQLLDKTAKLTELDARVNRISHVNRTLSRENILMKRSLLEADDETRQRQTDIKQLAESLAEATRQNEHLLKQHSRDLWQKKTLVTKFADKSRTEEMRQKKKQPKLPEEDLGHQFGRLLVHTSARIPRKFSFKIHPSMQTPRQSIVRGDDANDLLAELRAQEDLSELADSGPNIESWETQTKTLEMQLAASRAVGDESQSKMAQMEQSHDNLEDTLRGMEEGGGLIEATQEKEKQQQDVLTPLKQAPSNAFSPASVKRRHKKIARKKTLPPPPETFPSPPAENLKQASSNHLKLPPSNPRPPPRIKKGRSITTTTKKKVSPPPPAKNVNQAPSNTPPAPSAKRQHEKATTSGEITTNCGATTITPHSDLPVNQQHKKAVMPPPTPGKRRGPTTTPHRDLPVNQQHKKAIAVSHSAPEEARPELMKNIKSTDPPPQTPELIDPPDIPLSDVKSQKPRICAPENSKRVCSCVLM